LKLRMNPTQTFILSLHSKSVVLYVALYEHLIPDDAGRQQNTSSLH